MAEDKWVDTVLYSGNADSLQDFRGELIFRAVRVGPMWREKEEMDRRWRWKRMKLEIEWEWSWRILVLQMQLQTTGFE